MSKGRIVIAMSGGVDSSVSAHLLKEAGWEPIGLFMNHGEKVNHTNAGGSRTNRCCSVTDARDASSVAAKIGIPFYTLNYTSEFGKIKDYFVSEYRQGRTPIPCILCNQWLKFGSLLEFARSLGIDRVATGHYAKIDRSQDYPRLFMGKDDRKDQTYFMMGLTVDQLRHIEFPLGDLTKPEVREIASSLGLSVSQKAESQEICFVPGNDYRAVLRNMDDGSGFVPGNIVDEQGKVISTHSGIENFTVGQRHGLGISLPYAAHVKSIDPDTHTITVAKKDNLFTTVVDVKGVIWSDPCYLTNTCQDNHVQPGTVLAQTRYNKDLNPAEIRVISDDHVQLEFADGQFAVQSGQAAVWYRKSDEGMQMIGGGWIE